jgi:two-component system vancomycin resistance associated response regulator VraR
MKRKILIVDDQNMAREFVEGIITGDDSLELVKSISSASLIDVYMARLQIDLVIMDIVMVDGSSGLNAAEYIKKNYPKVKVILATAMPEANFLNRARQIGVEGFWYKESGKDKLLDIINKVFNGEFIYPDATPALQLGSISSSELTQSELEVLRELTNGSSNAQIGEKLHISANTVKTHIQHMLDKTGFSNRTELAIEARIRGIVIPD